MVATTKTTQETRAETIQKVLKQIASANGGRITPRQVVDAAKNPKHPLHDEFEWDDQVAADTQRIETARSLLRFLTITVIHRDQKFQSVAYVRDPSAASNEQGYIATTSKDIDRAQATEIVLAELDRCKAAIERARNIAGVLDTKHVGLLDTLNGMLARIVSLTSTLSEAA